MSETVTLTNGITGQIYGSFAAATTYLGGMFGTQYTIWNALTPDQQKQTLIAFTRLIDRQLWIAAADTFAERDAIISADGIALFQRACYEGGALVAQTPAILSAADQGSNIQRVDAGGGVGVTYFNPTSSRLGSAPKLPPIVMDLIGAYLASAGAGGPRGGSSQDSCAPNPFACPAERRDPWD